MVQFNINTQRVIPILKKYLPLYYQYPLTESGAIDVHFEFGKEHLGDPPKNHTFDEIRTAIYDTLKDWTESYSENKDLLEEATFLCFYIAQIRYLLSKISPLDAAYLDSISTLIQTAMIVKNVGLNNIVMKIESAQVSAEKQSEAIFQNFDFNYTSESFLRTIAALNGINSDDERVQKIISSNTSLTELENSVKLINDSYNIKQTIVEAKGAMVIAQFLDRHFYKKERSQNTISPNNAKLIHAIFYKFDWVIKGDFEGKYIDTFIKKVKYNIKFDLTSY